METSIVGVWTLRSFRMETVETGERSEPFGPEPRGTLMLHPDGRLVALLVPGAGIGPASAGGRIFQQLVAYSGRFRLEPPDRLVTAVDVACFPDWIGTDQTRTYRLDGDTLEIVTPPGTSSSPGAEPRTVIAILSWTREATPPSLKR